MSVLATAKVADMTIPNGGVNSNVFKAREAYEDAEEIQLHAPAALDAFTFTIEVTDDPDAAPPVWRTFQDGSPAADTNPPLAGKSRSYIGLASAAGFRIHSSAAVVADRTWKVTKQYRTN